MSVRGPKTMERARERATAAMTGQKVLSGRYELGSVLGRGGMAEVYVGTDRVLGRRIAVKILSDRFARDNSFVTRFRREAQSAAALNHPNVVSVFDTGSDDGTHFIVMEYVQGKTLYEMLTGHPPFSGESAVTIAYKHVKEEPRPPSRLNPDVPSGLDAIVMKCLAKNPANRYQNVDELLQDLRRFEAGLPVAATPLLAPEATEPVERATRPTSLLPAPTTDETERRRRWIAGIILGGILLIILLALFFVAKSLLDTGNAVAVPDVRGKQLQVAQ